MAAQTPTALVTSINLPPNATANLSQLPNAGGLDLIQITDTAQGEKVILNVTSTGVVNLAPAAPTNGTIWGVFGGSNATNTAAAIILTAFSNPSQQDILQVKTGNGAAGVWHLDYTGVSVAS